MSEYKEFDFAKAIKELEEINRWFQSEDFNLEKGLVKIRHGFKLIRKCRDRLKRVENEFAEIKKEFAIGEKESEGIEDSQSNTSEVQ